MKKAFNLFFLVLLLLPVAVVLFSAIANPSFDAQSILDFVTQRFVFTPFVGVFFDLFDSLGWSFLGAEYLVRLASYGFLVLLVKVTFDLVTFLPMLCMNALERKGDKN